MKVKESWTIRGKTIFLQKNTDQDKPRWELFFECDGEIEVKWSFASRANAIRCLIEDQDTLLEKSPKLYIGG